MSEFNWFPLDPCSTAAQDRWATFQRQLLVYKLHEFYLQTKLLLDRVAGKKFDANTRARIADYDAKWNDDQGNRNMIMANQDVELRSLITDPNHLAIFDERTRLEGQLEKTLLQLTKALGLMSEG